MLSAAAICKARLQIGLLRVKGVIRPQSEMNIHVTLCSNTLKKYDCLLHVDVHGIGKSILTLPLSANTIVPAIEVSEYGLVRTYAASV